MTKRCKVCAKKLNAEGKCTNAKCPNYIKEKLIAKFEDKNK